MPVVPLHPTPSPPPRDADEARRRRAANLAVFAALAVLLAVGGWVMASLSEQNRLESCVRSGRRDCVALPSR
ncbi:MAG: hypothetical protein KGQ28_10335 [Hyphomicrobiales bacterium]|nr:hypothetical protein [Hyphomicrobiales bacterium]